MQSVVHVTDQQNQLETTDLVCMHAPGHAYWQAHNADDITDMPSWASSRSLYKSCNVCVAYITFLMLNPGWLA